MANTLNGPNGQPLYLLSGASLRRMLRGKSATARGQIAAELVRRRATYTDLLPAQVARLARARSTTVSRALGRAGTRGPHRRTVARIVKRYGAAALLAALDDYTRPQAQAAE